MASSTSTFTPARDQSLHAGDDVSQAHAPADDGSGRMRHELRDQQQSGAGQDIAQGDRLLHVSIRKKHVLRDIAQMFGHAVPMFPGCRQVDGDAARSRIHANAVDAGQGLQQDLKVGGVESRIDQYRGP